MNISFGKLQELASIGVLEQITDTHYFVVDEDAFIMATGQIPEDVLVTYSENDYYDDDLDEE
jgi:hypothetical protein